MKNAVVHLCALVITSLSLSFGSFADHNEDQYQQYAREMCEQNFVPKKARCKVTRTFLGGQKVIDESYRKEKTITTTVTRVYENLKDLCEGEEFCEEFDAEPPKCCKEELVWTPEKWEKGEPKCKRAQGEEHCNSNDLKKVTRTICKHNDRYVVTEVTTTTERIVEEGCQDTVVENIPGRTPEVKRYSKKGKQSK